MLKRKIKRSCRLVAAAEFLIYIFYADELREIAAVNEVGVAAVIVLAVTMIVALVVGFDMLDVGEEAEEDWA